MTTPDDQLIKDFFDQMKENDRKLIVPDTYLDILEKQKKGKVKRLFLSIAASIIMIVAIGYLFTQQDQQHTKLPAANLDIDNMEHDIESMMSWSSATNELIEN